MNAKNLSLKFAFVAMLVAGALTVLHTKDLKQGIDLKGGHSLIFEIRTNDARIAQLQDRVDQLKGQIDAATDPKAAARLGQERQQAEREIDRLKDENRQLGDLPEKMIRILKKRVDPTGLSSLEWVPLGKNRIEIRMPVAKEQSKRKRQAYTSALARMEARNVQPSQIRRINRIKDPKARREGITSLADGNKALADCLNRLARASDKMAAAWQAYGKAQGRHKALAASKKPSKAALAAAKKAAEKADAAQIDARSDYKEELNSLTETMNIKRQEVVSILGLYVSTVEAETMANPEKVQRRMDLYKSRLEMLREKYPPRRKEIDNVVSLYATWAEDRQFLDNPADLKRLIAKAGVLEFRIAPFSPDSDPSLNKGFIISRPERDKALQKLAEEGPEGSARRNEQLLWFPVRGKVEQFGSLVVGDHQEQSYLLLYNRPGLVMLQTAGRDEWELDRAFPDTDELNRPVVGFEFNAKGARRFAELTAAHKGHAMAILLDDEVFSAPTIQAVISAKGVITGDFTRREVVELVNILEAGSLPARLNTNPVSQSTFGPGIGAENRRRGIKAAYVGLIAVATFMLVYYLLAGLIANVALVLNIIFVLGAMSGLEAVFTLPGIAGLILTIGIAVDANVLIFERLREEQAKGQSIRMAMKNAYDRALTAIFDANITTLITCLILGWVGTEEVRGFAITLGLGVMFSLFTALVVTRWVFQLLLDTRLLKRPVLMLRVMGTPKIQWMSKRYALWGISAVMMVMGIASLIWQGGAIWGIEFSSGTQAKVTFRPDALIGGKLPNDDLVRGMFIAKARLLRAADSSYAKLVDTAKVEEVIDSEKVEHIRSLCDVNGDKSISLGEWKAAGLDEEYFTKVDKNSDGLLSEEDLRALPSISYQISTTESDLERIRTVAGEAFGKALASRTKRAFRLAGGAAGRMHPLLHVKLATDGKTRITERLRQRADPSYSDALLDNEGGVMFVVENVRPSMSRAELMQRIAEVRDQSDFRGQVHPTEVVGLVAAGKDAYSSFAVLIRPSDPQVVEEPAAWDRFAERNLEMVHEAMKREDATVARNFDPAIAGKSAQLAIMAVVLSWLAIVAYLWLRFGSAQWGLAAVICLIHDVVIVVGLVAVSGWLHDTSLGRALGVESFKIDLAMVAAILTVIGYSVNDTIVVFDRIRENRGKLATISPGVIDASVNQTLPRTLLTSFTTLIVVLIMYVWGGPGIKPFSFALLVGILVGTYSSVAVASPLLLGFKKALVARTDGQAAATR